MQEKSKKYSKTVTKSRLPNYLHFRSDSIQYLFDCYLKMLGSARDFCRILCKLPDGQKLMGGIMRRKTVVPIDHGYDETKPESEPTLEDIQKSAALRGGKLLSTSMEKGDWRTKLEFECAFGHCFQASPRLVLEGGHWCDECERKSWNYSQRAKVDPFFAQVWNPLHDPDELREYPKEVSELDV